MSEVFIRKADRETIFDLAHKLTGTMESHASRHEIVITNVMRRMSALGKTNLPAYLTYISSNEGELAHFISAVTIHTTSWFREMPHYKRMERTLLNMGSRLPGKKLRVMSAACSTGEELYSLGMVLESYRRQYPGFDYELVGFDVDPICVQRADTGYYQVNDLTVIPQQYKNFLVPRPKATGGMSYLIEPEIRRRTRVFVANLLDPETIVEDNFDFVFCRNVMIYFSEEKCKQIIANLLEVLKQDGQLSIGHSENFDYRSFNLIPLGESTYRRAEDAAILPNREKPMSVLAIDESPMVRMWLATNLAEHGIRVHTCESTEAADEIMARNRFDLLTLDMNLPGRAAVSWLTQRRKEGMAMPVIILTETRSDQASEVIEALSLGSQDFMNKTNLALNGQELIEHIQGLVRAHRAKDTSEQKPATFAEFRSRSKINLQGPDLILAGASTGGTDALCQLFAGMPENCPPVVCVQHIPREFAPAFLERLGQVSGLKPTTPDKVKDLLPGHIYLSNLDAHLGVRSNGSKLSVYYSHGEKVSGHRPSVDYLFQTASFLRGKKILAVLLTGMGKDGASGLLELRRGGALTLAQDEQSSVVWGMPGEAVKLGAPAVVGNINELREIVFQTLGVNQTMYRVG